MNDNTFTMKKLMSELEDLKEKYRQYQTLVENSKDMLYRMSLPDGRYEYVSSGVIEVFGYTPDEMYASPLMIQKVIHPDFLGYFHDQWERLLNGDMPPNYEYKIRHRSGETRWVNQRNTLFLNDAGIPIAIEGTVRDVTESKKIEEELKTAKDFAENLLETANTIVVTLDSDARITTFNRFAEKLTGYSKAEVIGRNWIELFVPNGGKEVIPSVFEKALDNMPEVSQYENPIVIKNGEERLIQWNNNVLRNSDGEITGVLSIGMDVTRQKAAEELLRKSEEKFRVLTENTEDIVISYNIDGIITYINPRVEQYGYRQEEVISRNIIDFVFQEDRDIVLRDFQKTVSTGTEISTQFRIVGKNNNVYWVEDSARIQYDDDGNMSGLIGVIRDITERKRAEAAIRESEERYRLLAETARDIILLHTIDGVITYANKAGLDFTGYMENEFIGKIITEIIPEKYQNTISERLGARLRGVKDTFLYELEFVNARGELIPLEVNSSPIVVDGKITSILVVARDISERKAAQEERGKLEAQLRQSQKMEAIGQLAGGVAHDFNNLLMVIAGNCELAMMHIDSDDALYSDIQEIKATSDRAAQITRQLLAFSRKDIISPEVLNLNDIISEQMAFLERLIYEDISIRTCLAEDLWNINIDPTQVHQILMNFTVNSCDAIEGSGTITIETRNAVFDEEYCDNNIYANPGDYVLLSYTDSGNGIDSEIRDKVFEPFFTTKDKSKGTGLGLSTVYGIVKQNDGIINVYSEPGMGATFNVYFPRCCTNQVSDTSKKSELPLTGTETVMIVEDESNILNLVKKILSEYGYNIIVCKTVTEAIDKAQEDNEIHLLLTDVVMPEMNGRELNNIVKELKPGIKTLFMSGYSADVIANRGVIDHGVNFIQKPFQLTALIRKVREVLDE